MRKTVTITTEQVRGILERLGSGQTTMKAEATQLGIRYAALRRVLEQVVGFEAYLRMMEAQRLARCVLPPSKNFLLPETEKTD